MKTLLLHFVRPIYIYFKSHQIKSTLYPIKNHLISEYNREYHRLYFKYKNKKINSILKIRLFNSDFYINNSDSLIYQFEEIFLDRIYDFKCPNDDPVIFDCGANVGLSCIFFKKIFPNSKIIAFEADDDICRILDYNTKNLGINVINAAVFNHNNGVKFHSDGSDGGSIYKNGDKKLVRSVRLKDYIDQYKRIDFLKLDVEGAEFVIINDIKNSLKVIKNIFIEFHSFKKDNQCLDKILSILSENDFRYFINSLTYISSPFINDADGAMDLQLNIFASRK